MPIAFFQVDAFASRAFEGNQACVMALENFLPDDTLQAIAAENNVAETAFIVPAGKARWQLRWFTPAVEVPLCGHATLAAAHVLFNHLGFSGERIIFETRKSGELIVDRGDGNRLEMDFPASPFREIGVTDEMERAFGVRPLNAYAGSFLALGMGDAATVRGLSPDLALVRKIGAEADWGRGNVGVMAGGDGGFDVVSRFFAPGSGIDEDPATGSWHCLLAPVWRERTGKSELSCFQACPGRGARIGTRVTGDRVILTGPSVTVIEGAFAL